MNQLHVQMVLSGLAQAQVLIAGNLAIAFIAEIHPNVVNKRIMFFLTNNSHHALNFF